MEANETTAVISKERYAIQKANETQNFIQKSLDTGSITVPKGFNWKNELQLMFMKIAEARGRDGRSGLDCTPGSINLQCRLAMQNGLSAGKDHVYVIVRGDQLCIQRSYFGGISQLKRIFPNYKIVANVIFEGDEFNYFYNEDTGTYQIIPTKVHAENRDKNILYAFGSVTDKSTGEIITTEVMSRKEIDVSWSHAQTNKVQQEFPQEMAKRTLLNRMIKVLLKTSDVDSETIEAFNQMTENETDFNEPKVVKPTKERGGQKFDKMMDEAIDAEATEPVEEEPGEEIPF